jgi:hypothetical protein
LKAAGRAHRREWQTSRSTSTSNASFKAQLEALQPQIQAELERLRPEAERMFMNDPTKPVYAVVHTKLPKVVDSAASSLAAPNPAEVDLAEPIQLKREQVGRTYETSKKLPGSPTKVIERHVIESIEIKMVPEE